MNHAPENATVANAVTAASSNASALRVVKLGGSLLELPDLPQRLLAWRAEQPPRPELWVVGGGQLVDALRHYDSLHRLAAEPVHELAIRLMGHNAQWVAALLASHAPVVEANPTSPPWQWFSAERWLANAVLHRELPAAWEVTSDSIAGLLAVRLHAVELVLLKSALPPQGATLAEASRQGFVDPWMVRLAEKLPPLRVVDLRRWPEAGEQPLPGHSR